MEATVTLGQSKDVERIIAAVQAREDALADGMLAEIARQIDEYAGDERAELRVAVREHCLTHVRLFLDVVVTGRALQPGELPFLPATAAQRVQQGVPLDAVLHAFRVGHRCVWDAIVATAADDPAGEAAALAMARPSMEYIDSVSSAVADAYLEAQLGAVADQDRGRRDLLDLLLEGRLPLGGEMQARAVALGFEPPVPYVVGVVAVTAAAESSHTMQRQVARAVEDRVREVCTGVLLVARRDEIVGLFAPRGGDLEALRHELNTAVTRLHEGRDVTVAIGMSTEVSGLDAAALAYREARRALAWASPGPQVVALPFVSVFDYLIASADDTARRIPSPAGPLLTGEAMNVTVARDTLLAYFDGGLNVRRAAEELGIHANTMHYRLRRIAEVTGCDLHDFRSLIELLIALRLRDAPLAGSAAPENL